MTFSHLRFSCAPHQKTGSVILEKTLEISDGLFWPHTDPLLTLLGVMEYLIDNAVAFTYDLIDVESGDLGNDL
jgi:hypothetical protein